MVHQTMFSLMALSTLSVSIIVGVVSLAIAIPVGMLLSNLIAKQSNAKNVNRAKNIIQDAINEAKTVKKEAILEAKDEVFKMKSEAEAELKERRAEITKTENRII